METDKTLSYKAEQELTKNFLKSYSNPRVSYTLTNKNSGGRCTELWLGFVLRISYYIDRSE